MRKRHKSLQSAACETALMSWSATYEQSNLKGWQCKIAWSLTIFKCFYLFRITMTSPSPSESAHVIADSRPFGVISEATSFWDERQLPFPLSYNAVTIKSREKPHVSVRSGLFPSPQQQWAGQGWTLAWKPSSHKASPPGAERAASV